MNYGIAEHVGYFRWKPQAIQLQEGGVARVHFLDSTLFGQSTAEL